MGDVVETAADVIFAPIKALGRAFGGDDKSEPTATPPAEPKPSGISEADAQKLAKSRLFRSGTVFTNTLGEDLSDSQTEGTRLI